MTILLRATGINTNASGGAITVTLSAAPQAGDLIVLVHKQDPSGGPGTAGTVTPPFSPGAAYGAIDDANYVYLTVWKKIASGSEGTSAVFGFTGSASDAVAGVLVYYSSTGGTLDTSGALQTVNDTTSGTTWGYPALTTPQANCMAVIGLAGTTNNQFPAATNFSGWGAFTERIDQSISASYSGLGMADQLVATATTVAAGTVTSALSDVSVGFGLVITETGGGDTTAPTLTSPTGTATGSTTASGTVSTDEANGTAYAVVTVSGTAPTAAQVRAGQDNSGAAAAWSGNQAVTTTGTKNFSATGLAASTAYYFHFHHRDAANNDSTVVSSAQFTTSSGATTVCNPITGRGGSAAQPLAS